MQSPNLKIPKLDPRFLQVLTINQQLTTNIEPFRSSYRRTSEKLHLYMKNTKPKQGSLLLVRVNFQGILGRGLKEIETTLSQTSNPISWAHRLPWCICTVTSLIFDYDLNRQIVVDSSESYKPSLLEPRS